MNDGTNNSGIDTDNGTNITENGAVAENVSTVPEDINSDSNNTGGVSDTMGNSALPVTDTESDTENTESGTVDNTETNVEVQESSSNSSVDYTYELNNIEYWQTQQLAEMQAVQNVSGNSIMVTLDDASMQTLTEIQARQDTIIESQNMLCNFMGCLVFAVCAEWLIGSAKRTIKHFTGRKE